MLTTPDPQLAIVYDATHHRQCTELAQQLHLPVINAATPQTLAEHNYPYVLMYVNQQLVLQQTGPNAAGPVSVDFIHGAAQHRYRQRGSELITKAIGKHHGQTLAVMDATAGTGRDSFVLASRGYTVTAIERVPVVAALLSDGLTRAMQSDNADMIKIINRITLKQTDAIDYLHNCHDSDYPDIIYIDPMFPPSRKSALVKKNMRAFHQIVGPDTDSARLLEAALQYAKYRVIVKRSEKAQPIADQKPTFATKGNVIRYDVYCLKPYK